LLTIAAASTVQAVAQSPVQSASSKPRADLALGYSYLHGNAPPGGCGCFNVNGGNATFAWPLGSGQFALAGDVTVAHAGTVSTSGDNLTLSTFTAGVRYLPPLRLSSLQPFGQVLLGLAHSSGTLVQGSNPGAANAGTAFAGNFGGGLDLHLNPRFSIRLAEADYLLTTFDNGSNNHQNNLRISAGVVIRF
jgi:outer membrane immunogenic protein